MSNLLLCSSGTITTIWSVNSNITSERQFPESTSCFQVIDWNQNSNYVCLFISLDNYLFLCSDKGQMVLQSVKKDTCITAENQVGDDQPGIILVNLYNSTYYMWYYSNRKSFCNYW